MQPGYSPIPIHIFGMQITITEYLETGLFNLLMLIEFPFSTTNYVEFVAFGSKFTEEIMCRPVQMFSGFHDKTVSCSAHKMTMYPEEAIRDTKAYRPACRLTIFPQAVSQSWHIRQFCLHISTITYIPSSRATPYHRHGVSVDRQLDRLFKTLVRLTTTDTSNIKARFPSQRIKTIESISTEHMFWIFDLSMSSDVLCCLGLYLYKNGQNKRTCPLNECVFWRPTPSINPIDRLHKYRLSIMVCRQVMSSHSIAQNHPALLVPIRHMAKMY